MAFTTGVAVETAAALTINPDSRSHGITAVPGVRVGHFTETRRPTGCTAVLFEGIGATAGSRGGRDILTEDTGRMVEHMAMDRAGHTMAGLRMRESPRGGRPTRDGRAARSAAVLRAPTAPNPGATNRTDAVRRGAREAGRGATAVPAAAESRAVGTISSIRAASR